MVLSGSCRGSSVVMQLEQNRNNCDACAELIWSSVTRSIEVYRSSHQALTGWVGQIWTFALNREYRLGLCLVLGGLEMSRDEKSRGSSVHVHKRIDVWGVNLSLVTRGLSFLFLSATSTFAGVALVGAKEATQVGSSVIPARMRVGMPEKPARPMRPMMHSYGLIITAPSSGNCGANSAAKGLQCLIKVKGQLKVD